jgi:outer membrane protein assembly factor BamB
MAGAVLVLSVWSGTAGAGTHRTKPPSSTGRHHRQQPKLIAAAESGLLPWQLPAAISREVVLPAAGGQLTLLGGLTAGGTSADEIFSLDPADGSIQTLGSLPAGVHDAAGAVVRGRDVVFGGGSPTTVATIDAFQPGGPGTGTAGALVAGQLPAPRSDAVAVSVGKTSYVVGGYDGTHPDGAVLATTDGTTFTTVARLRVPVRYPAVAALGGDLYVFGGEPVGGSGGPVNLIQLVVPSRHAVSVVGHLPEPLVGAVAMVVGGAIYVAGGSSPGAQTTVAGVGSALPPPPPGTGGTTVSTIWAFDPKADRLLPAGRLQQAVAYGGATVVGSTAWIVGGEANGSPLPVVQMLRPNRAFGGAGEPGAGSPYFGGRLLVADRGNNRLLLLDPTMRVDWMYPSASSPPNPGGFYFPDDAFFIDKGTAIISNQEENETIEEIAFPSGKVVWTYGHPGQPGSAPGYLHEPDDAYLRKNRQISVADADNCRVLVINANGTVAHQIGTTGSCVHNPPSSMGSPNGDTPLADGNLLVSEINGSWVSEYTPTGSLVWTLPLPISYPSDPQQLGSDLYLVADYASPGQVIEFDRAGQVSWSYDVTSGPGELNHPSLAERLPSGVIMLNDDYGDRMVAIDPVTDALVWQYGVTGVAGTGPGMLNTPDGFDLLMPGGATPTHSATG